MGSDPSSRILPPPVNQKASGQATASAVSPLWITSATLLAAMLVLGLASQSSPLAQRLFTPVQLNSLTSLVLLLLATFCALVLHEAGHLLGALACRFEIVTISLGFMRFTRGQSGWRVQGKTKRVFTGSVFAFPKTNEFWRARMFIVVSAGPLATLCGAILAMACIRDLSLSGEGIRIFLQAFFQVSFLIFILGLVPNGSHSKAQNDAGIFLALWRDGSEANAIFLYHLVLQHQHRGLDPREFPLWLVELMATFQGRDDFRVLYAGMLASWAFDRGDHRTGDLWDAHALRLSAEANPATQHACLANSACFDLVFRHDLESAKSKLARIQVSVIGSPSLQHRALAARNLALGRVAKGLAEVAVSRSFLPAELQHRGFDSFFLNRLQASAVALQ